MSGGPTRICRTQTEETHGTRAQDSGHGLSRHMGKEHRLSHRAQAEETHGTRAQDSGHKLRRHMEQEHRTQGTG